MLFIHFNVYAQNVMKRNMRNRAFLYLQLYTYYAFSD